MQRGNATGGTQVPASERQFQQVIAGAKFVLVLSFF
jgi:hypothetical protein